jgi:hypothetical protein
LQFAYICLANFIEIDHVKGLIPAVLIASALAAPTLTFAQDDTPVTRSAVKADLQQNGSGGLQPGSRPHDLS